MEENLIMFVPNYSVILKKLKMNAMYYTIVRNICLLRGKYLPNICQDFPSNKARALTLFYNKTMKT